MNQYNSLTKKQMKLLERAYASESGRITFFMLTTLVETNDTASALVGKGYLQSVRVNRFDPFLRYEITPDGKRLMEDRQH